MQVFTNGALDNAQTTTANIDGVVASSTAEDMRANNAVDGVPFLEWQKIAGATVNVVDYNLQVHEGGLAFAFCQTPQPGNILRPPNIGKEYELGYIWLSPGVLVDGGGWGIRPGGGIVPIPPWGPLMVKLLSTIAILSVSTNLNKALKADAMKLASAHLKSLADSIQKMDI